MRHTRMLTKATPASAVESGLLTKSQGGFFGFNEIGDFAIWIAGALQSIPVIGPWLVVLPSDFNA